MRAVIPSVVAVVASLVAVTPSAAEPEDLRTTRVTTGNVHFVGSRGDVVWRGACLLYAAHEQTTTGGNYEGVFGGGVAAVDAVTGQPANVPFRCFVRVNFVEVDAAYSTMNTVVDRAGFAAGDTDYVDVCAETSPNEVHCGDAAHSQLPAQAVEDVIVALSQNADPALCPLFAVVRGVPGVAEVTGNGDIYVLNDREWDCPMYDD